MSDRADIAGEADAPSELWLGLDRLVVPFAAISAVLVYAPMWDRRIAQSIGDVPAGIQSVVLTDDGRVLPSRRALADLHQRWMAWQQADDSSESDA